MWPRWIRLGLRSSLGVYLVVAAIFVLVARWPLGGGALDAWSSTPEMSATKADSLTKLTRAALAGRADAQNALGMLYREGDPIVRSDSAAAYWFRKAAQQNHAEAQRRLGDMYVEGVGVPEDLAEAKQWFERSAGNGDEEGQFSLCALLYGEWKSSGNAKTRDEAMRWLTASARQGYGRAEYALGRAYRTGDGVPKDLKRAVQWLTAGAAHQDPYAQTMLATMYIDGEGVAHDSVQAEGLLLAASRRGSPEAQTKLAVLRGAVPFDHSECLEVAGGVRDIFVTNTSAYLASGVGGLQIVDISRRASPRLLSTASVTGYAMSVAVVGHHAFVTAGPAGYPMAYLHAFDVSDSVSPQPLGSLELPDYPERVVARDTLAFVADRTGGLRIVSISRPDSLTERGFVETPGVAMDVVVNDRYAFVADRDSGLRIIDVAPASSPREVGFLRTAGPAVGVALLDQRLFVALGPAGVLVVDVRDPFSPSVVDTLETIGNATGVAADGGLLFVPEGPAGVEVFDVSHLGNPQCVRILRVDRYAGAVRIHAGRVWVADIVPLHGYLQEGPSVFCEDRRTSSPGR